MLELVSTGSASECPRPDLGCDAELRGISEDGRTALFATLERLTADDTNLEIDLYRRSAGTTTRIGPVVPGMHGRPSRLSRDGGTAVFNSHSSLVPEDDDGGKIDVYEHTDAGLRLLSGGPEQSPVDEDAKLEEMTPDAGHVFFNTKQALIAADTDLEWDLYERFENTLRVVTPAAVGATLESDFDYVDASEDGSRVHFSSWPDLVPEDTNELPDLYERSGGQITLVSAGPAGAVGNTAFYFSSYFVDRPPTLVSADGTRVAFVTQGVIDPQDQDAGACGDTEEFWTCADIYLRTDSATSWISPVGCCEDALLLAATPTLDRIFFRMYFDATDDIYRWENGDLTLITDKAKSDVRVVVSGDGERVIFVSDAALVPEDRDNREDVYESFNGTLRLVSTGPADAHENGTGPAYQWPLAVSADGRSVFFTTDVRYVAEDDLYGRDVYERTGNETTLLSKGPTGQGTGLRGGGVAALKDGRHVYFYSDNRLTPNDTDDFRDLYVAKVADPARYPRPKYARSIRVPLVPAARACTQPNRRHGPPLDFDSCSPVTSTSPNLTVGGSGNPAPAKSAGRVRMTVRGAPGGADDSDVRLALNLTNVMKVVDSSDYTGELRASVQVRLTDRAGGISTTTDFPFGFTAPCTGTADTTIGGHCAVVTSADAVLPGLIPERTRAIWEVGEVQVYDGGPDQDAETLADNSLFATQGLFVP